VRIGQSRYWTKRRDLQALFLRRAIFFGLSHFVHDLAVNRKFFGNFPMLVASPRAATRRCHRALSRVRRPPRRVPPGRADEAIFSNQQRLFEARSAHSRDGALYRFQQGHSAYFSYLKTSETRCNSFFVILGVQRSLEKVHSAPGGDRNLLSKTN